MVQDPVDKELAYNNENRQVIYQTRAMGPLDDIGQQFDNNNVGRVWDVLLLKTVDVGRPLLAWNFRWTHLERRCCIHQLVNV